jgi:fimbrial chaperone protein
MKNKSAKILSGILACTIFSAALLFFTPDAHATFISPKRVLIEEKQRAGQFNILNRTQETIVYRFDWERYSYSPDGLQNIVGDVGTSPGYQPADPYLQFSPRQVILKPGESQTIRILVRRPANLPQGEYRSNILIQPTPLEDAEKPEVMPEPGVQGMLKVRTNVSIPIMLRQGATTVNFEIAHAGFALDEKGRNSVDLRIANNSTRSLYMNPELDCVGADGTVKTTMLSALRLFVEIKNYSRLLPIPVGTSIDQCSAINLRITGQDDFEFKNKLVKEVKLR